MILSNLHSAATDIFGIGQSLTTHLEQVLAAVLILALGGMALHYVFSHQVAKAVGLCVVALIPALFVLDPGGAKTVLTSAVHAIGG